MNEDENEDENEDGDEATPDLRPYLCSLLRGSDLVGCSVFIRMLACVRSVPAAGVHRPRFLARESRRGD